MFQLVTIAIVSLSLLNYWQTHYLTNEPVTRFEAIWSRIYVEAMSKMPGNISSLQCFMQQLDSLYHSPSITPVSLFVTSSSSPEGSLMINKSLTRKRNQSVINYLNRHSELFRNISTTMEYKPKQITTNHRFGKIRRSVYPSLRYSKVTVFCCAILHSYPVWDRRWCQVENQAPNNTRGEVWRAG